jgi:hypothetical protein
LKKLSSYYLCNRKTAYLNPPLPAGGCIFHLTSYFRRNQFDLTNRCSERRPITFVSRGVPVSTVAQIFSLISPNERGYNSRPWNEPRPFSLNLHPERCWHLPISHPIDVYSFYQMLRTHLSLEGLLCNRMRKMKMMMSFFLLFDFNGAPVELS